MKRLLCMLVAVVFVFSAAYISASAEYWTYEYIGLNEFPEGIETNPEACYVDGFAMLYTHEIAGDRFSYENGALSPLDSAVLRYNWFIVFEPVSEGSYKASYAGNNIVTGQKSIPLSEDGVLLAFNYWEGDGRISCAPLYQAYLYTLGETAADLYNDYAVPEEGLWADINQETNTIILTAIDLEPGDDESEPVSEAESEPVSEAESEPVSEAESEPVSEAESEPVSEAESKAASEAESEPVSEAESEPVSEAESEPVSEAESKAASEAESKAASEPADAAEDKADFPWIWVIVGVAVVAAAVVAVIIIKKKKA